MELIAKLEALKVIKFIKYLVISILIVIIYNLLSGGVTGLAFALETEGADFGISVLPSGGFIQAPNIAPGDTVSADLTVKNEGKLDFAYDVTATLNSEDPLLYNALRLTIKDGSTMIYAGKLKDLTEVAIGVLGPQQIAALTFSVAFPPECGNEYQGKGADVTFVIRAQEHPAYLEEAQIIWDPPLDKPDAFVRKGSVMPIRFHLIKDGEFDTVKRGIDLLITGQLETGEPVEYRFSITDNSLSWEERGLNKPHYVLMFEANKCPVKLETLYTATVIYGNQNLGSTSFVSGNK